MMSQITGNSIVYSTVFRAYMETWKLCITLPLWGESTGDWWLSSQRASEAENISMSWRLHMYVQSRTGFKIQQDPTKHNPYATVFGCIHDDVIKWKHFPRHWPIERGIHWSPVNSPHKGQWRGAFMFSLIGAWIKCLVNNGEAGDLRRHRAHYDVIVMVNLMMLNTCCQQKLESQKFSMACHPLIIKNHRLTENDL